MCIDMLYLQNFLTTVKRHNCIGRPRMSLVKTEVTWPTIIDNVKKTISVTYPSLMYSAQQEVMCYRWIEKHV